MSAPVPHTAAPQPAAPAAEPTRTSDGRAATLLVRWAPADELRVGLLVVVGLAVLGALLGILWQRWSPPGPLGFVVAPHAVQADETEAFVAADGRFAVISLGVGLPSGLLLWLRRATRGPVAVVALAVGGLAGALLTNLVGHLLAGGRSSGPMNTLIAHLPLTVHMRGLLLLEAASAVLVYCVCAAFAPDDDLGRPDLGRRSVGVGEQRQHAGGHADAPGGLEQRDLPPQ